MGAGCSGPGWPHGSCVGRGHPEAKVPVAVCPGGREHGRRAGKLQPEQEKQQTKTFPYA